MGVRFALGATVVGFAVCLSGCVGWGEKPVVMKRYNAVSNDSPEDYPTIEVSGVAREQAGKSAKKIALVELSDRGQAALIKESKGKPPAFISEDKGAGSLMDVQNAFDRSITISVAPANPLPPGDRISSLQLTVQPVGPWKFLSWDRAANEEKTITVGTVSVSDTNKVSASTSFISNDLIEPQLGVERGQSITQGQTVIDESRIAAHINAAGGAVIYQKAGWMKDLIGNITIDAKIGMAPPAMDLISDTFALFSGMNSKSEDGKPGAARDVAFSEKVVFRPKDNENPVCGEIKVTYTVRHILGGQDTFTEADDTVNFLAVNDVVAPKFVLIEPLVQPIYLLTLNGTAMHFQMGSRIGVIQFQRLDDAMKFRNWLEASDIKRGQLKNVRLGWALDTFRPLNRQDLNALTVTLMNRTQMETAARNLVSGCK
ncbi:hypothetical protein ATDW_25890 [Asticcacaulis sp. DW145]|uniref:hypothetical protein n=1 Tax=Asticcacaulis sp. DW145 TaxID=3095608 RepID=UPI0030856D10|nr:hypothetical protein ATDW_25890 [Asticcacaulis sp. DW145]